jgi:hypothetical protein
MSKFRRTASDESSSYSSEGEQGLIEGTGDEDEQVSALALMNEKSPEAWLGNFLTILNAPPTYSYTSVRLAGADDRLHEYLSGVANDAAAEDPERMLEPGFAEELRQSDWNSWWRAQDALSRYAYATLALAMLGDAVRMPTLVSLYRQEENPRLQKDAHYVLTYLLGKEWPGYAVTESDLLRVAAGEIGPASEA